MKPVKPDSMCRMIAPYLLGVGLGLIVSVLFTGCGASSPSIPKSVGGSGSAAVISVSLDDAWTSVTPNGSEIVQLADTRYFIAPTSLSLVQGAYSGGNPSQNLHARLLVGSEQCEYLALGTTASTLTLQSCSGGLASSTLLPSGTTIELSNYDCPGFLVQANFDLTL
jgi:hypothetical protein